MGELSKLKIKNFQKGEILVIERFYFRLYDVCDFMLKTTGHWGHIKFART